jgi:hypothetical protein
VSLLQFQAYIVHTCAALPCTLCFAHWSPTAIICNAQVVHAPDCLLTSCGIYWQTYQTVSCCVTVCAHYIQVAASAANVEIIQGDVVSEVRQVWPGLGALVTRLWKDQPGLDVEWSAGPPPSGANWELFVRYSSTIKSGVCCCNALWGSFRQWLCDLCW